MACMFNLKNKNIDCRQLCDKLVSSRECVNQSMIYAFLLKGYIFNSNINFFSTIPRIIRLWHALSDTRPTSENISSFKKKVSGQSLPDSNLVLFGTYQKPSIATHIYNFMYTEYFSTLQK